MHQAALPFAHSIGPQSGSSLAIVGEAWGKNEATFGRPFCGWSGLELARVLHEADLAEAPPSTEYGLSSARLLDWWRNTGFFITNAFALRPEDNKIEALCGKKNEVGGDDYHLPPFRQGKYFRPEYLSELDRLKVELQTVKPNLVLAVGGSSTWALLQSSKISSIRGTVSTSVLVPGLKVLPSYHPAYVLRDWAMRPILLADCLKAKREMTSPFILRPERTAIVGPPLGKIEEWTQRVLSSPPAIMAMDIETWRGQIEMISFAISRREAIVIPFIDWRKPDWHYWATPEEEIRAVRCMKRLCESPIPKLFQNGLFDMQYIARYGIRVFSSSNDTMLLHHSLYPELQKGLGFLGSIYTNESSWKLMRTQKEEIKKDE